VDRDGPVALSGPQGVRSATPDPHTPPMAPVPGPSMHSTLRLSLVPFLAAVGLFLGACSSEGSDQGPVGSGPAAEGARGFVIQNPTHPDRPYFHDFDRVPFGGTVAHVYQLENTDPVPITIRDLKASCGCTAPRVRYTDADGRVVRGDPTGTGDVITIPPGVTAELEVRIDTEQIRLKNRDKLASVHLRCDSHNQPFMAFEMHVIVDLAFQAAPAKLDLGRVGVGAGASLRCDIIRDPPKTDAEIVAVAATSPGLTATLEETLQLGKTVWVLVATIEPYAAEPGFFSGYVDLATTQRDGSPDGPRFRVPVTAMIEQDLYATPRSLGFRKLEPATDSACEVQLASHLPGHRFEVLEADLHGDDLEHLRVEFEARSPDDRGRSEAWTIRLHLDAGYEGAGVHGTVIVRLDDEQYPEVRIPFLGRTRQPQSN